MKKYLSKEQFDQVRRRIEAGDASLTIPRRVARQFFTHVNNASIKSIAGRSLLGQKFAIWAGVFAAPALLVVCIWALVLYFDWFAALAAPLAGTFWTIIAGLTGDKGEWWYGAVGLAAGLALAAILEEAYAVPVALMVVSLFVHRVTYRVAQVWLIDLVSTSYGAYDMLVEHIDLDDPELAAEQTEPSRA